MKAIRWCAYHTLVSLPCLVLLYTVAWPVNLVVHYLVGPAIYYALCLVGLVIEGSFACVAVPTRLAFKYLFLPPARLVAGPFVRSRAASVARERDNFRQQFGLQGVSGFTHDQLVFGPHRHHLGRARMMLQTAESDLSSADTEASGGYWFGCLSRIWRAEDQLANARKEMSLIAAEEATGLRLAA